jgi:predicted O-methyltransferase YrrM
MNRTEDYCSLNSSHTPKYLLDLERETNIKTVNPRMLSGQLQGRLLSMLSKLIQPKRILEIGTFTGYATLCLAEGLDQDGIIDTIEINREYETIIKKGISNSPYKSKINLHFGNALTLLDQLKETYDLVFIDASKDHYIEYYEKAMTRLRTGGLILADNVLWSGKVILDPEDDTARIIHRFNRHVLADERSEIVMLPLRDGVSLIRKTE